MSEALDLTPSSTRPNAMGNNEWLAEKLQPAAVCTKPTPVTSQEAAKKEIELHGVLRGYSIIPCIMLQGRSHDSNGKVDDVLPSARIQDILAVATWVRFVGHKVSLFLATKWRFLFFRSAFQKAGQKMDLFTGYRDCSNALMGKLHLVLSIL